ncbi:MAG: LLM class flavin-dependent oxidoreductase, partial [Candidatus Latescibacterota bacterium]
MHVGAAVIFQSYGNDLPDRQIYANDLSLVDLVEPLGFESIWGVEHHFTDYTMCPDVYQFLSYCAGRTKTAKLGSLVLVLPWHDPLR